MTLKPYGLIPFFLWFVQLNAQTTIKDKQTQYPVSYATISFGNGNGLFADDEGQFIVTKKLYPDIDSIFVSALGYKKIGLSTATLPKTIFLEPKIDELDEVVIIAKNNRKFKEIQLKPYLDDDYYKCWLPTIESEIAVFFPNTDSLLKQIAKVHFPITLESKDWSKRKRVNADKRPFSTLFKVTFYKNDDGFPGKELNYKPIVFRVTEKDGDAYNLDVSDYDIYLPKSGIFVSLQVLGYTDKNGKLLPNKKYKEIKTVEGTVKIPTNFRPLLPFTDAISEHNTYIKRVFLNDNQWTRFEKGHDLQSGLLKAGLTNYGIGLTLKVYKDE
ncbi:MAG: hypothetical protein R2812_07720 [Gelidibacter sp.]